MYQLAQLFWPDFVDDGGCTVLALNYSPESMNKWRKSVGHNRQKIEAALNHVHLYDYVGESNGTDLPKLEAAAEWLADCWRQRISSLYPGKKFEVVVRTEPDEYGPTVSLEFS